MLSNGRGSPVNKSSSAPRYGLLPGHIPAAQQTQSRHALPLSRLSACVSTRVRSPCSPQLWNNDHAPDKVEAAVRRSLAHLRLEYLDLYLIHWPVVAGQRGPEIKPSIVETWRAMEVRTKCHSNPVPRISRLPLPHSLPLPLPVSLL